MYFPGSTGLALCWIGLPGVQAGKIIAEVDHFKAFDFPWRQWLITLLARMDTFTVMVLRELIAMRIGDFNSQVVDEIGIETGK